ncbi:MAG: hypothetical protein IIY62_06505, partial [Kiritimatiellae bacterium]|nr:hypothetical protein [Kiritimatiellia bacterium]
MEFGERGKIVVRVVIIYDKTQKVAFMHHRVLVPLQFLKRHNVRAKYIVAPHRAAQKLLLGIRLVLRIGKQRYVCSEEIVDE